MGSQFWLPETTALFATPVPFPLTCTICTLPSEAASKRGVQPVSSATLTSPLKSVSKISSTASWRCRQLQHGQLKQNPMCKNKNHKTPWFACHFFHLVGLQKKHYLLGGNQVRVKSTILSPSKCVGCQSIRWDEETTLTTRYHCFIESSWMSSAMIDRMYVYTHNIDMFIYVLIYIFLICILFNTFTNFYEALVKLAINQSKKIELPWLTPPCVWSKTAWSPLSIFSKTVFNLPPGRPNWDAVFHEFNISPVQQAISGLGELHDQMLQYQTKWTW